MPALACSAPAPLTTIAWLIAFVVVNKSDCEISRSWVAWVIFANNSPVLSSDNRVSLAICLTPSKPFTKSVPAPVARRTRLSRFLKSSAIWIISIAPNDTPTVANKPCKPPNALATPPRLPRKSPCALLCCATAFVVPANSFCKDCRRASPA